MRSFHLLHLTLVVIIGGSCGEAISPPPPTEYDLVLNFPSLQATKNDLDSISAVDKNGKGYTGREIVDRFLTFYNPNTGAEGLRQTVAYWGMYASYFRDTGSFRYQMPHDSMTIYLYKIAHALWAEVHGSLPWSLRDVSADDLQAFFWGTGTVLLYPDDPSQPVIPHIEFKYTVIAFGEPSANLMGEVASLYYGWSLAQKLRQGSIEATTTNTIKWVKDSFCKFSPLEVTDHSISSFELALRLRTIGDYGFYGARVMQAIFTALNIPNLEFLPTDPLPTSPTRPIYLYLPTLRRFIEPTFFVAYVLAPSADFLLPGNLVKNGRPPLPQILRYVNADADSPLTSVILSVDSTVFSSLPHTSVVINTTYQSFTPDDIAKIAAEFPQYPVRYLNDGTWVGFEPLPMRSFEELITPGIDIWH